ncbi:suppressor protein SRP40 [Anopheles merus]|uniref:suppressor protein SRP40 n=1 Tax=Anopheles merus TaxID=30066 RepID=UPI001BE3E842|nr:suppressor protein SRP40 [Anopheles merus]
MLRFALLFVALAAFVAAGPTVRKDEAANAITPPTEPEEVEVKPSEESVKLPVSNDEPANDATSTTTASETKPTESVSTTTVPSTTGEASPSPSPTTSSSTTTKAPTTAASVTSSVPTTKPPRKTITFDQRQEGKYNIRADLENFVIVVVPSGSSSGASLLDLLTRSAHKKDALHQTRKASHKRKHHKAHSAAQKKIAQATPEVIVLDETHQRSGQLEAEEFIEGRTPYKVDLSSSARSVDGADSNDHHHHQAAAAAAAAAGNKPSSFTFSLEPSVAASRLVRFPSGNYPQPQADGRALRFGGHPNTNTLAATTSSNNPSGSSTSATNNLRLLLPGDGDNAQSRRDGNSLLVLRPGSGSDGGAIGRDADPGDDRLQSAGGYLPPATVLVEPYHSYHAPSSFDSLEYEPARSDVDMTQLQLEPDYREYDELTPIGDETDGGLVGDWEELRLLGAQEQCGPDRKRDSYGVCQFVQP